MPAVEYRGMTLVIPDNDSEWKEYFAAARAHRLILRACVACGRLRYPPSHGCPWCADLGWTWREVSGRGTIHSYEIVVHAIQPGFRDWAPYPVVLVELDEQRGQPTADEALRIVANLSAPPPPPTSIADSPELTGRPGRGGLADRADQGRWSVPLDGARPRGWKAEARRRPGRGPCAEANRVTAEGARMRDASH